MDKHSQKSEGFFYLFQVISDLVLINLLWFVCSLPVITAGTSTCAAFSVMLKLVRGEGSNTIKSFFKAFKDNFKRGVLYGLIVIAAIFILYVDISFALAQEGVFRYVCLIAYGIMMAIVLIFVTYVFPLQARYENTFRGHIKNAFLLTFCAPGKTILMWIIYSIPIAMFILLPFEVVLYIAFFFFLFSVSLPMYFNSKILRQVFDIFVKDEQNNDQRRSEEAC
ncbi:MAG: DUF624 domain-containing protein [Eubacteriales bacterium]|nr:DUF624 domain-containing protein [Eubacteriales bacterium]